MLKCCQVVHNRLIPALWSSSVLRHNKYSCWGPILACDSTSPSVWITVKLILWGEQLAHSHCMPKHLKVQVPARVMSLENSDTDSCQARAGSSQFYTQFQWDLVMHPIHFLWSKIQSTDTSFFFKSKCLLLIKLYFCWQLRAFDLCEQHVFSSSKFTRRLASSLPHRGSLLC